MDTNAIIDLTGGLLPSTSEAWLENIINRNQQSLSVVTRIEVFAKPISVEEHATIQLLIDSSLIYGLTESVIQETIRLRQTYRRKLPDAIIAATALVHNLTLVTRDAAGFRAIAGLKVIDPHDAGNLPALP